ncbi:MAG TPA: MFS transporter [Gemmataceae bacterium]|jgi:MFS family permease|nr:MFS transporter [Gemmataceae bacterium]
MHSSETNRPVETHGGSRPWWRLLTRYHWFVLTVAALGWLFDTMDQQLFNIARRPAIQKLLEPSPGVAPDKETVAEYSGYATSIFLIGWGTGGIGFGILGDLIGRVRTMIVTILLYSAFTGLSAISRGFWDFAWYRFLTGLGVGGEFAVGVSLVAEVMPDQARPFALALLQALSAVGNITAAVSSIILAHLARAGITGESWRIMFLIGAVPAFLAIFIFRKLKEPERWRALAAAESIRERVGAYFTELFKNPRWARNAVIGLVLASSGIIGLWAIGFFSIDLQRAVFADRANLEGLSGREKDFYVDNWAGWTSVMLNLGACLGIFAFSFTTHRIGRRPAFAISFVLAMLSTAFVFWKLQSISDIFWMIPIMGFCQLALFGGYAIYFPELFPTRLRSTGTSFCYNGARYVAALGPTALGLLTSRVFKDQAEPLRYAGITMCAVFIVGLLILPFAPETRGQPLPESD